MFLVVSLLCWRSVPWKQSKERLSVLRLLLGRSVNERTTRTASAARRLLPLSSSSLLLAAVAAAVVVVVAVVEGEVSNGRSMKSSGDVVRIR